MHRINFDGLAPDADYSLIYEDEELKSRYPSLLMPPPSFVASGGNIPAFKPGEGIRVAFPQFVATRATLSERSRAESWAASSTTPSGRLAFASLRRPRVSIGVAVTFIRPVRPASPW